MSIQIAEVIRGKSDSYERNGLDCRSAGAYRQMRAIDRRWLAGSALLEGYKSSVKTYGFHDRNERINLAYRN